MMNREAISDIVFQLTRKRIILYERSENLQGWNSGRNKKSRERFSQILFKSSVYAMSDTLDKKRES